MLQLQKKIIKNDIVLLQKCKLLQKKKKNLCDFVRILLMNKQFLKFKKYYNKNDDKIVVIIYKKKLIIIIHLRLNEF